jgi:hypothetical protein
VIDTKFKPPQAARGIKNRLGASYFPTIQYTNTYEAELAVSVLKEKKKPTIGLVERAFIPKFPTFSHSLYQIRIISSYSSKYSSGVKNLDR